MRVSDGMRLDSMTRTMATNTARHIDAAAKASSGSRITHPSDDPVAAAQAARVQASIDQTGAYRESIKAVRSDAELTESTLSSAGDLFQRAQELAIQGANGTLADTDRASIAQEVSQLKEELIALANQKGSQGYLFGGTQTDAAPFDDTGNFLGNDESHIVELSPSVTTAANVSGSATFTSNVGGVDTFGALDNLRTALLANDQTAIVASVSGVDSSRRQILAGQTEAGSLLSRLDVLDASHEQAGLAFATERHDLVDTDPAAAYSELIASQNAIDQSIAVSRNILNVLSVNRFG